MTKERIQMSIQTIKDNIKILEEQQPNSAGYYLQLEHEKFVLSALEKQIPKKPIKQFWVDDEKHKGNVRLATKDDVLTKDNHGSINLCPNCKEWVMRYKYLRPPKDKDYFCKHCGQALDWGDGE